jgi:hypothetical protein
MTHLEPTYLRYIYDGLVKGSIHPENAAELPEGLIGLYEEAFDESQAVQVRQKLLERFAIWALLKKEVSAAFVAEVLGETEDEIQSFISTYSAWFNSPESGKYQLYHERLKVYLLQKMSEDLIKTINLSIVNHLKQQLLEEPESFIKKYALEFQAHHLMIHYLITDELKPLLDFVDDKSIWSQQISQSNGHFWTLNTIQIGLNASLFANQTGAIIRNKVHYLSVEFDLINDVERLRSDFEREDIEHAETKIRYLEKADLSKLQSSLLYLLTYSLTKSDKEEKLTILTGIAKVLKHLENPQSLDLIPDSLRFEIASFYFDNDIEFKFLFPKQTINYDTVQTTYGKAAQLDMRHSKFIEYLLEQKEFSLSDQIKNAILFSSLKSKKNDIVDKVIQFGIKEYCSNTVEYLAEHYFIVQQPDLFFKVISNNDSILEQLLTLAVRMLVKGKMEQSRNFIQDLPDPFYRMVMFSQLAEAALYLDQPQNFDIFLGLLKDSTQFPVEDSSEIISMLEFKRTVSLSNYTFDFSEKLTLTQINQAITGMSIAKNLDKEILLFFQRSGVALFSLNDRNINLVSRILGTQGDIEQYLSQRRSEIKRKENQLYTGAFDCEDNSLFYLLKGMSDLDFMNEIDRVLTFYTSQENLGDHYRVKSMKIRKKYLFFLYYKFKNVKERMKSFVLRMMIINDYTSVTILEQQNELINLYVDFSFTENNLFDWITTKTLEDLNTAKLSWDKYWHLAKISSELFELGDKVNSFQLLQAALPTRWEMHFIKASKEWEKMTSKFLTYFKDTNDIERAIILVNKTNQPINTLHQISLQFSVKKQELKESMIKKMSSLVAALNPDTSGRITREIKHRTYFSAMILEAELKYNLGFKNEGLDVYKQVCNELFNVKNSDDLQIILLKLCLSLIKYNVPELYSEITKRLDVIDIVVIPFQIKGWYCALSMLREELLINNLTSLVQIVELKLSCLNPEPIVCKILYPRSKKTKTELYYLLPFSNYQNSLYNATKETMLKTLVRYLAYQCFVKGDLNDPTIQDISQILDFQDWIQLRERFQSKK